MAKVHIDYPTPITPPPVVVLELTEHQARIIRTLLFRHVMSSKTIYDITEPMDEAGIHPYDPGDKKYDQRNSAGYPEFSLS